MSWWMLTLIGVGSWIIWSVVFSLCFSAWMRACDARFVSASVQSINGARRAAAKQPVWIMPDCGCAECVAKRAAAKNNRSVEQAYDRVMREMFEDQED